MDVLKILAKYYHPDSTAFRILLAHGSLVAERALAVAARVPELKPDRTFIKEAAMLHDIGIYLTASPSLGCTGTYSYIAHGYLGRQILVDDGLHLHALVCERHVGVGISAEDVLRHNLPLPVRDMIPLSIEERIICYADKFYSKIGIPNSRGKSLAQVRKDIASYGEDKLRQFETWVLLFKEPLDEPLAEP